MIAVEHVPVLYGEVLAGLDVRAGGRYIDCTAGSGGHAAGILEASAPDGALLALDTDPEAIRRTRDALGSGGVRLQLVQANFRDLAVVARREGWSVVDGILFDLGVSSPQIATPERGFSFQEDGPLDMRMDPRGPRTAADLVNTLPDSELSAIFRQYGEEPQAGRIAAAIVRYRVQAPIRTTAQMAALVAGVKGGRGRIHPATTVFQALRIAVNDELASLAAALPQAVGLLRPGGSLHDEAKECRCPPQQPVCTCDRQPPLRLLGRHAVQASEAETGRNPRARSARLRVAERLCYPTERSERG